MVTTALTIAGSEPGGGAGIVADLKTFEAHGVWGLCAVTCVTQPLPPEVVEAQVRAVAGIGIGAAKTGLLPTSELVRVVAASLRSIGGPPLVVDSDPAGDALPALRDDLLPLATVVTANLAEAATLVGVDSIDDRAGMEAAAEKLCALAPRVALVTGGDLGGDESPDVVWSGGAATWLEGERFPGPQPQGAGSTLSAAICAEIARGMDPVDACVAAKHFVAKAIAARVELGGVAVVNPGWEREAFRTA